MDSINAFKEKMSRAIEDKLMEDKGQEIFRKVLQTCTMTEKGKKAEVPFYMLRPGTFDIYSPSNNKIGWMKISKSGKGVGWINGVSPKVSNSYKELLESNVDHVSEYAAILNDMMREEMEMYAEADQDYQDVQFQELTGDDLLSIFAPTVRKEDLDDITSSDEDFNQFVNNLFNDMGRGF